MPFPRRNLLLAAMAGLIAIGQSPEARAESSHPPGLHLQWRAPDVCPDAAYIHSELHRLLGRTLEDTELAVAYVARASVHALPDGGFRLDIVTEGESAGERHLEADECRTLAGATALILALWIDPDSVSASEDPLSPGSGSIGPIVPISADEAEGDELAGLPDASAGRGAPTEPPSDAGDKAAEVESPPEPSPADATRPADAGVAGDAPVGLAKIRLGVRVLGGGDFGSLPAAAPGLSTAVAVLLPRSVRVELLGGYWFERRALVSDGVGGDVDLFVGALRGCWIPTLGRLDIGGCGGLEVGLMRARAFGVTDAGSGQGVWLAATAGGVVAVRIVRWLAIIAHADARLSILRPRFVISNVGEVHRPATLGARLLGGLEARFP